MISVTIVFKFVSADSGTDFEELLTPLPLADFERCLSLDSELSNSTVALDFARLFFLFLVHLTTVWLGGSDYSLLAISIVISLIV